MLTHHKIQVDSNRSVLDAEVGGISQLSPLFNSPVIWLEFFQGNYLEAKHNQI